MNDSITSASRKQHCESVVPVNASSCFSFGFSRLYGTPGLSLSRFSGLSLSRFSVLSPSLVYLYLGSLFFLRLCLCLWSISISVLCSVSVSGLSLSRFSVRSPSLPLSVSGRRVARPTTRSLPDPLAKTPQKSQSRRRRVRGARRRTGGAAAAAAVAGAPPAAAGAGAYLSSNPRQTKTGSAVHIQAASARSNMPSHSALHNQVIIIRWCGAYTTQRSAGPDSAIKMTIVSPRTSPPNSALFTSKPLL